jgi:ABC-type multidrug transport system ATPase subunit
LVQIRKRPPDVVKGLSLTVRKGEFLALLGGNGTGKPRPESCFPAC